MSRLFIKLSIIALSLPFALNAMNENMSSPPAKWTLVWADEFNHCGLPDTGKWTYEYGYVRNGEAQFYTVNRSENARVEEGSLIIEARMDAWGGNEFTSASLTTKGIAQWKYGRFEVRAKIPTGRGMWPAIWMLGSAFPELGWPKCGEIDIMENVGYLPEYIHNTIHTNAFNHAMNTQRGAKIKVDKPWEEYHIYSVEWSPYQLDFYYDDMKTFTFSKEGKDIDVWPFDTPQYLILNVAVGGGWGGAEGIDRSIFPQRMEVDYVRVYQQVK